MTNEKEDQEMLDSISSALDKSCDSLDGYTLSRLNKIRHAALAKKVQGNNFFAPFGIKFVASIAVSAVVVLVVLWNPNGTINDINSGSAIEDLEILISADSLEFFEDIEFYQWLEENEPSV